MPSSLQDGRLEIQFISSNSSIQNYITDNKLLNKLYPNPANDNIQVEQCDKRNNHEFILTIYSTSGSIVKGEIMNEKVKSIDIGHLQNGLYFLSMKDKVTGEFQMTKFIKY